MRAILLLGVLVVAQPAARGTPRAPLCEKAVKAVAVRPEWEWRQARTLAAVVKVVATTLAVARGGVKGPHAPDLSVRTQDDAAVLGRVIQRKRAVVICGHLRVQIRCAESIERRRGRRWLPAQVEGACLDGEVRTPFLIPGAVRTSPASRRVEQVYQQAVRKRACGPLEAGVERSSQAGRAVHGLVQGPRGHATSTHTRRDARA
mmetsp:Transcript_31254/g.99959  ORF Transcript_31254/g.99959 Transcript_31254/m.99959 type:complete len:204 (-) Transcript_31254:20-631(-)